MQITLKNLRNRFSREQSPITKEQAFTHYKIYRNKYVKTIFKKKQRSWNKFLEESQTTNTWGNTYRLIKTKIIPKNFSLPILDSTPPHQHPHLITNLIENLFPSDSNQNLFLPPNNQNNRQIHITPELINSLITKSNSKKAPGPDHITNSMLKQINELIAPTLSNLFNKCLDLRHFPRCWKKSQLTIFSKPNKSDYSSPDSYRPISLISTISKLLEKSLFIHLQDHLTTNSLLNPNQHGFSPQKSTITALTNITKDILNNKSCTPTAILSIDYSKAFDTANWNQIIKNMIKLFFPFQLIQIIRSYLNDRSITFNYNKIQHTKNINQGCPQGSPLSPLLWNILINPLLNSFNTSYTHIHAYADDLNIICTGNNSNELNNNIQTTLSFISNWSNANHLTINPQKTQILHFHKHEITSPITLNGKQIAVVDKIKILGLTFSNHKFKHKLNFNTHINNIINKVTRIKNILFNFCKNTYGLNSKKRQNLYKGLIRPTITYGCEIWADHITKTHTKKLESLQHTILKNSVMAYKTVSKTCITSLTNIEPIHTHILIRQSKFKLKFGLLSISPDINLKDYFINIKTSALIEAHHSTNNIFQSFFPSTPLPKHIRPNFYTTQFITGHGHFLAYLHRFNLSPTNICLCSQPHQDPTHLLLFCPRYTQIKTHLKLHTITTLHDFVNHNNTYTAFEKLCKHIYKDLKTHIP